MSDAQTEPHNRLEIMASRNFSDWLDDLGCSLAFTTYQAGKLFLVGVQENGRLSIFERTFNRCMGLWGDGQTLWMSSLYQLWRFENALEGERTQDGYDRVYVPQLGYTTGDLDIHDLAPMADGRVAFVNTRFSCLATTDERHSFRPLWTPPFVSRLAPEDRCHMNGLAMGVDGMPAYVTAVAASDVADGWRDRRVGGGIVVDVASGDVVLDGLSMPHSPRLVGDELWLLNAGTGEVGRADLDSGRFEPVAFCPGFLRGMAMVGKYAIVGISRPREAATFGGLPLDDRLAKANADPRCGLMVIDRETGDTVHWVRLEGVVEELYDIAVLPGVKRPMAIGFRSDEISRIITVGDA